MNIRKATMKDSKEIFNLYKEVATAFPDNLTQEADEINRSYIETILLSAIQRGFILVIEIEGKIVAYFKAFTSSFRRTCHILTNATIMVHPKHISCGYGKIICQAFIDIVIKNMPHIKYIELRPFGYNEKAIAIYKKLGFYEAGKSLSFARNLNGVLSDEVILHYNNPNFTELSLLEYHKYLSKLNEESNVQEMMAYKIENNENLFQVAI